MTGRVGTVFFSLATNALLTRLLGPIEMGVYFLVLSFVAVAAMAAQLGLNHTVVRLVSESLGSKNPANAKKTVNTVIRYGVIGAALMALVIGAGAGDLIAIHLFASEAMGRIMTHAALLVFSLALLVLVADVFRGFQDFRLASLFSGLAHGFLSAAAFLYFWSVYGGVTLETAITVTLAATSTSLAASFFFLHRKLSGLGAADEDRKVPKIFSVAWPLFIVNITLIVFTQIDIWIMGIYRPHEVAVYAAAAKLVMVLTIPIVIINTVISPFIAEMHATNRLNDLERLIRSAATVACIPALMIAPVFFFFGGPVLGAIYGKFYGAGSLVLVILCGGQLINVCTGSCAQTLMMTGHQVPMMIVSLLAGALSIAGSVFLVKPYGGAGVALATATAIILQNILMIFIVKKKIGIWTHLRFYWPDLKQLKVINR